jgi:TonB-linked SusC/RagA family outer membrane protein
MRQSALRLKATRLLSRVGYALGLAVLTLQLPAQSRDPLTTSINIDADRQPLEKVLRKIASNAHVKFAYDIDEIKKYTVTLREKKQFTLQDVLKKLLEQTDLVFESHSNTIVIYSKDPARNVPADSGGNALVNYATYQVDRTPVTAATIDGKAGLQKAVTTSVRDILSGTVQDDNGPLQSATVQVKGTKLAAVTDAKGNFNLEAGESTVTLVISSVGYQTREVVVRAGTPIIIKLEHSDMQMDKVVVVGYGTQKRATVSGAVSDVKLDKLSSRSLNNVTEALQGKAPGVIVTNEGGDPTSAPRVNIRGMGGINGEGPLYVVDGSVYSNFPINPNEIESISVLKDAAAAIYGARASGGVIIITTKRGRAGTANVTMDAKYGVQSAWRKLQPLNAKEYADVMNISADNGGKPRLDAFNASIYPDGQITRTNWIDDVFRKGHVQDYNVGVNGGTEKSKYYMSFGYRDGEAILLNTNAKRYNFRLNTDFQVNSWLKVGENMQYVFTDGNGANTSSAYTGALLAAIFYPPSVYPYNADGSYAGLPAQYAGAYGDVINPVAYLKRLDVRNPTNNFFINPYLEIRLMKDLSFRSNLAFTRSFSNFKEFDSKVPEIGKLFLFNQLTQNENGFREILTEQTLNYTKAIGDHHLNALAGYTYQRREDNYLKAYAQDFDDERPAYRYMQNANTIFKPESGKSASALISYLARVNYDYNGKYLLSLIARRDGSSLVAIQNHFANYGSVSAGWLLTKEDFLSNVKWLNMVKLRGSYGVLGNLGSLPTNASVVPLAATTAYLGLNQTQAYGYAEDGIANPDLKWAKSVQSDVGVDVSAFDNRLSLTADYFIKKTQDMILQTPPPSTLGVSSGKYENVGEARDRGIELGINYNGGGKSDFQYSIGVTLTKISNKLVSLKQGITTLPTTNINIRNTLTPVLIQTGYALYSYNVIQTAGIFKSQAEVDNYKNKDGELIQDSAKAGDLRFVDANHDGKITNADKVVVGNPYPSFTYGFSFNASYKNFDLNIFAQGVQGNKLFNGLKYLAMQASVSGQNYNMLKDMLGAWSPTNVNSSIPRASQNDPNSNYGNTSDWFIESGSYLRIKNVTLGYTLPASLSRQAHLNSARIYFTANNLLTFTGYKGFDPEVGMDEQGIDKGRYPQARTLLVGLNLNF